MCHNFACNKAMFVLAKGVCNCVVEAPLRFMQQNQDSMSQCEYTEVDKQTLCPPIDVHTFSTEPKLTAVLSTQISIVCRQMG